MTEICNRCLVNLDSRSSIVARHATGGMTRPPDISSLSLKAWAVRELEIPGTRIEVDATTDRFAAISTWHGDPVCVVHLWDLVDAEQRKRYQR